MNQMFWVVIDFLLALFAIGLCYIKVHEKPHKSAQSEKGEIIARGCVGRAVITVAYACVVFPAIKLGSKIPTTQLLNDLSPEFNIIVPVFLIIGGGALFHLFEKRILRRWKIWRLMFWWIIRGERENFMRSKRK